jgi:hypothetical protein
LVGLWNSFAGVPPFGELKSVSKFTDRKTALRRIWTAIQRLEARPRRRSPTRLIRATLTTRKPTTTPRTRGSVRRGTGARARLSCS